MRSARGWGAGRSEGRGGRLHASAVHTEYSLLDGQPHIARLVEATTACGMLTQALSDHLMTYLVD